MDRLVAFFDELPAPLRFAGAFVIAILLLIGLSALAAAARLSNLRKGGR